MRTRLLPPLVALLAAAIALAIVLVILLRTERQAPFDEPRALAAEPAGSAAIASTADDIALDSPIDGRPTESIREEPRENVPVPTAAPLPIAADKATLTVHVIVKETRKPLGGARVLLWRSDPGEQHSVEYIEGTQGSFTKAPKSDADGVAVFDLEPAIAGRLSVDATDVHGGVTELKVEALKPGERREVVVEVPTEPDLRFFGRIVDAATRAPIADCNVTASSSRESHLNAAVSDADGSFDVLAPSWQQPYLRLEAPGYGWRTVQLSVGHATREEALEIPLERSAMLRGRVVDLRGHHSAPISIHLSAKSWEVEARSARTLYSGFSRPDPKWQVDVAADGRFEDVELPSGVELRAEVREGGAVVLVLQDRLRLEPGEKREVEWKLGGGCALRGTVIDQFGKAVARRELWMRAPEQASLRVFRRYENEKNVARAITDDTGRFELKDVHAGRWWVGPAPEHKYLGAPDPNDVVAMPSLVEIPEGALAQDVVITVDRGLYIRGEVVDPDGRPVKQGYVLAFALDGAGFFDENFQKGNTFALGPLKSGRYRMHAKSIGHASSQPIEAEAGQSGLVLELEAGGKITGRVVPALGETLGVTEVRLIPGAGADASAGVWMSGAKSDGTYSFGGLAVSVYDVVASDDKGNVGMHRNIAVSGGEERTDIDVMLERGAQLRIRYTGQAQRAMFEVHCDGVRVAFDGLERGSGTTTVVPAGNATIMLQRYGPTADAKSIKLEQTVIVARGETKDVVFTDDP